MKSLHIRNLDEYTLEGLKRRAARHRRSLQKEVEVLLEDASRMVPPEDVTPHTPRLGLITTSTGKASPHWARETIYTDDER